MFASVCVLCLLLAFRCGPTLFISVRQTSVISDMTTHGFGLSIFRLFPKVFGRNPGKRNSTVPYINCASDMSVIALLKIVLNQIGLVMDQGSLGFKSQTGVSALHQQISK